MKSATCALLWLALVAGLLSIVPAFGQIPSESMTKSVAAIVPVTTTHIRKNPLIRIAIDATFPDGTPICDWDTDQNFEYRICPEAHALTLPSVKITGACASRFYKPAPQNCEPWKLKMPKNCPNPYLLPNRIESDPLSQQCEEFVPRGKVCARTPARGDLFALDNEVSWIVFVPKGEVERYQLAGLIPLGSKSRDTAVQVGIVIKVEDLPCWLKFCPENKEIIAKWMRYEDISMFAPRSEVVPPVVAPPAVIPPVAIPPVGVVPAPVVPVTGPPMVVNVDLSAIRTEINGQLGALGATVNAHADDIAALKTTVAGQQVDIDALKNRPSPTATRNTSFVFMVHWLTGSRWTLEITDKTGTRCQTYGNGVVGAKFKVACDDGNVTFRVMDCKTGCWGPSKTVDVSTVSCLDYYWERN